MRRLKLTTLFALPLALALKDVLPSLSPPQETGGPRTA